MRGYFPTTCDGFPHSAHAFFLVSHYPAIRHPLPAYAGFPAPPGTNSSPCAVNPPKVRMWKLIQPGTARRIRTSPISSFRQAPFHRLRAAASASSARAPRSLWRALPSHGVVHLFLVALAYLVAAPGSNPRYLRLSPASRKPRPSPALQPGHGCRRGARCHNGRRHASSGPRPPSACSAVAGAAGESGGLPAPASPAFEAPTPVAVEVKGFSALALVAVGAAFCDANA